MRTSSCHSGRGALLASVALFALLATFWETGPSSSSFGRQLAGAKDGQPLPEYALFFPIICLLVGVVFYYIIGRFLHHAFPYTASMFIFGQSWAQFSTSFLKTRSQHLSICGRTSMAICSFWDFYRACSFEMPTARTFTYFARRLPSAQLWPFLKFSPARHLPLVS